MSKRLTGLNPLAYIGVEPLQPPNMFLSKNAPTTSDSRGVNLGDFWMDETSETLYVLVSLAAGIATWVTTFGGAATTFITDSGAATPSGGVLNVNGDGLNIMTSGSGNTITISENPDPTFGNVTIQDSLTLSYLTGGVLVSNGSGDISEVVTTNHSLLVGNATGTISNLGVATNGQIPIGSTGANPVLATITAGTGISVTNGAGTITIANTEAGGSVTSITAGTGITLTPSPITTTGSVALTVPVVVANGGTGDTSFTAYSVITGGTTSTGALQNVSGVGTAGQVLTSNGAAALPTWQGAQGAGLTLIQTQTASTVASLSFTTGITNTFRNYFIICDNLSSGTGSVNLIVQLSTNGGSTYITTGYFGTTGASSGLPIALGWGGATVIAASEIWLMNLTSGAGYVMGDGNYATYTLSTSVSSNSISAFYNTPATTVNAIRVTIDNTVTWSGNVSLYGYSM